MVTFRTAGSLPARFRSAFLTRAARALQSVPGLKRGAIGIRFVSEKEMQTLNRVFRGMNRPTDVLSFSVTEGKAFPSKGEEREIGDLVLCATYATREAKRRAINPTEELVRLVVHGALHLAGMDHATLKEETVMFRLQERVVKRIMNT